MVSIRAKLFAVGLFGVTTTIAGGYAGLLSVRDVGDCLNGVTLTGAALRNHLESDMMHDALRGDVYAALIAETEDERDAAGRDLAEHVETFRALIADNRALPLEAEVRGALDAVGPALEDYCASARRMVDLAETDKATAKQELPEFMAAFRRLEDAMEKCSDQIETAAKDAQAIGEAHAEDAETGAIWILSLSTILLTISSGILAWSVAAALRKSIDRFRDIAEGEGDFTKRLDDSRKDELGDLGRYFNLFASKIQELILDMRASSESLAGAATELTHSVDEIAEGARTQAASLEQTASSVEEIAATVKHSAGSAQKASEIATSARTTAEHGGKVVEQAVVAMGEISQSSKQIAEIINTINDIAFQTNLLALNAAVEAARAGEEGRGFAVVASEVRNLAQHSAGSAQQIKNLIEESLSRVERGRDLVNRSGASLNEIVNSVNSLATLVTEISHGATEQSVGIEQINHSMTDIERVTQEGATRTGELGQATASVAGIAESIHEKIARYKVT